MDDGDNLEGIGNGKEVGSLYAEVDRDDAEVGWMSVGGRHRASSGQQCCGFTSKGW